MMDIFNMLGGMGQAQQTVGNQLGTTPSRPKRRWKRLCRCCSAR